MQLFIVCKKDVTDQEITAELGYISLFEHEEVGKDRLIVCKTQDKKHAEFALWSAEEDSAIKDSYEIRIVELIVRTINK